MSAFAEPGDPLEGIAVPLKTLLTMPACPPRWKHYDLYLFRDQQVVFYVGQSFCAFERVWEHLKGGPHGHSIPGRFLLCNWPRSAHFVVALLSSAAPAFDGVGHDLDRAERLLIERHRPCLNVALNGSPTALPPEYLPPNASNRHLRTFRRMLREATYAPRPDPASMEWEE